MATIQERVDSKGKAHYRVQVRLKGYPPDFATFDRKTDAKKWAAQTEAAIREGRHFRHSQARKHTLTETLERYIEDVLPRKPKSARTQEPQLLWWKDRIGHYVLADVTPALIVEHRDAFVRETSASNANRYMAALSHVFTVAMKEWGWIDDSPFRKISRLPEPRGRVRFLDEKERADLLEKCRESQNPNLYDVVVLALSTGCRKSEILNLRWPDIDLERGKLTLLDTKNKTPRAVPLVGYALERMKERSKFRRVDTNYVFAYANLPKPADIDRDFARARDAAGLKDFRFHDLRHTAASYLAMNGATLAEIAAVLGHKTLQMVQRYAHLSDAHTASVVERMNKAVFHDNGL